MKSNIFEFCKVLKCSWKDHFWLKHFGSFQCEAACVYNLTISVKCISDPEMISNKTGHVLVICTDLFISEPRNLQILVATTKCVSPIINTLNNLLKYAYGANTIPQILDISVSTYLSFLIPLCHILNYHKLPIRLNSLWSVLEGWCSAFVVSRVVGSSWDGVHVVRVSYWSVST
jgi:hypothetical protein